MSDRNKNRKDSLSEFLRYKQGKMSVEERNSFERELQKDPFAEEAAEGFELITANSVTDDISILQKHLKSRITGRRRYIYYSIAASVAVLMVISTLYIVINKSNTSPQIAEVTTTEDSSLKKEVQPIPVLAENKKSDKTAAASESEKRKEENKPVTLADAMQGAGAAERAKDVVPPVSDSADEIKISTINSNVAELQPAAPMAAKAISAKAYSQSQIKTDSDLYSLDEVVVVGYGVKKNDYEEYDTPPGYTPPQPVGGRTAFNKYIEENINRPDTISKGQRVVVVINFTVLLDGSIDSLKIVRSPGKSFSDEALRLLKSGPGWKPAEENGQAIADEVKIRIIFR